MSKLFFEVFPTLKVSEEMKMLLAEVEVTKVASNSARDFIRVHIFSRHLIKKRRIYELEKMIKEQLFGRAPIRIEVREDYQLSAQYTPENLMREYYDSILLEAEQKSVVERNMLQTSSYSFEDGNIMCLTLQDTVIAQGKKDSVVQLLTSVFNDRFHVPLEVRVVYEKPKESSLKYNDLKLQQEVDAIVEKNQVLRKERLLREKAAEEEKEGTASEGKKEDKSAPAKKPEEGQAGKSGSKGGFKGGFSKGNGGFRKREFSSYRKSDDPNVIYGRDFDDAAIELKEVVSEMGEITIRGKVISFDTREIRNEKTIIMYAVTDFTDTIMVKMFVRNEQLPDMLQDIKMGAFLKIKGVTTIDKFDGELTIGSVTGIRKIPDFTVTRKDTAPEKRVELHCHTKMSDMDGVSEVKDIVKRAHDWGHKAIAITDHGVVQAFTDANHYIETLDKDDPFKVIYGVEAYLVDDLSDVAINEKGQDLMGTFIVFDLETTGFSPIKDKIIEIGAVKVEKGKITDKFSTFVNPQMPDSV